MKIRTSAGLALILLGAINSQLSTASAQGTAFTYQGRLNDGANPASGSYDLTFALFDASSGVNQTGDAITNAATAVSNGLFTVTLDFGNQFLGANRWLEIAVRTNGDGVFGVLTPRQPITPTPYALYAANAGSAATATTAGSANSVSAANLTGTVPLAQLPASVLTNNQSGIVLGGTISGDGSGLTNLSAISLAGMTNAPSAPTPGNAGTVYFNLTDKRLYYSDGSNWLATGSSQSVYRWAVWSTYDQAQAWFFGNSTSLLGGVAPSSWSDNNATAAQISSDKKVQAALFNKKAAISPNSVVWAETRLQYSSSDGRLAGALFRVRNNTGAAINWPLNYYATAYPGWGETASITLNGGNVWSSPTDSYANAPYTLNLSIPANRVSTVICIAGGSPAYSVVSGIYSRSTVLAFGNNCLTLPTGLEFVDDLDTATGGYGQ